MSEFQRNVWSPERLAQMQLAKERYDAHVFITTGLEPVEINTEARNMNASQESSIVTQKNVRW
jgi:hypothetical protein